jgi:hypothetical protein
VSLETDARVITEERLEAVLSVRSVQRIYNEGQLLKYGDLALQVGGVSDETVKYGREFCGTST